MLATASSSGLAKRLQMGRKIEMCFWKSFLVDVEEIQKHRRRIMLLTKVAGCSLWEHSLKAKTENEKTSKNLSY